MQTDQSVGLKHDGAGRRIFMQTDRSVGPKVSELTPFKMLLKMI